MLLFVFLHLHFLTFSSSSSLIRTDWKRGIRSHLYEISRHLFDVRKRENQCYCHGTERLIDCDGYTNVAGCFGGLPFALSFPHFFGHPRLQSGVYGLNPNSETHLSHMNLEPNMGILFDAELKFQLNIIMKDFPTIGQLGQIQNGLLPFFKISLVSENYLMRNSLVDFFSVFFFVLFQIHKQKEYTNIWPITWSSCCWIISVTYW